MESGVCRRWLWWRWLWWWWVGSSRLSVYMPRRAPRHGYASKAGEGALLPIQVWTQLQCASCDWLRRCSRHVTGPLSDQRIPGPSECKKWSVVSCGAESVVDRLIIHRLREKERKQFYTEKKVEWRSCAPFSTPPPPLLHSTQTRGEIILHAKSRSMGRGRSFFESNSVWLSAKAEK